MKQNEIDEELMQCKGRIVIKSKPCPSCGGKSLIVNRIMGTPMTYLECTDCHLKGKTMPFLLLATKMWNRVSF